MPARWLDLIALDDLLARPAPRNPKGHDADGIRDSITRHGVVENPAIDERTGLLVAGHGRLDDFADRRARGETPPDGVELGDDGRWMVYTQRGWSSASDSAAEAYVVASNRLVEAGGWDEAMLADLFRDYESDPDWLTGTGYSHIEVDALLADHAGPSEQPDALTDPDDVPEVPVEPVSQRGDVFLLDRHRVVCGDCRSPDDMALLMGGVLASCLWTDPPYGVGYVGKTKRALTIENDGKEGLRAFIAEALGSVGPFLSPGSPFYLAAPPGPQGTDFRLAVLDAGWSMHEVLVWVKDQFVLGHSDYHYRHEDVLYGWLPGPGRSGRGNHEGSRWAGDHAQDSVFEVPRPKRSESHPTMKPVALIVPHLTNSTAPGAVILDPFGGSGSTMIAAHQTGRTALLCEVDGSYVDVICRRFQEHTGVVPILESSGEPVDFLA